MASSYCLGLLSSLSIEYLSWVKDFEVIRIARDDAYLGLYFKILFCYLKK